MSKEDDLLDAASKYRDSLVPLDDDPIRLRWHGLAIVRSFMAGAHWERERIANEMNELAEKVFKSDKDVEHE